MEARAVLAEHESSSGGRSVSAFEGGLSGQGCAGGISTAWRASQAGVMAEVALWSPQAMGPDSIGGHLIPS